MHAFAKILLVTLCVSLSTGPSAWLQMGAWGWMVVSYAQEDGLEQALRDTFGGDKPCSMCHFVEAIEADTEGPRSNETPKETEKPRTLLHLETTARLVLNRPTPAPEAPQWTVNVPQSALRETAKPPPRAIA